MRGVLRGLAWPYRAGRGGILGLVALLAEHYEAVEADLAALYGPQDQLSGLWTGALSYRRLWILIQGLPGHAKTREKVAGREWWSDEKTLLAHIANQQSIGNWLWLQSKSKDTVPRPELITLPGQQSEKPVAVSPSRRRYLERLRLNQGSTTKDGDA